MKQLLLPIICSLLWATSIAQFFNQPVPDFNGNTKGVAIQSEAFQQSSDLQNGFINKFLYGGTIDSLLINDISEGLNEINYFGAGFRSNARFYLFEDSTAQNNNHGMYVGLAHDQHLALQFHRNLFNLAFIGNEPYAGDTLPLFDSRFLSQSYQQLEFGIVRQMDGSSIGISIVRGHQFQDFQLESGSFYTAQNGTSIQFQNTVDFSRGDTVANNFMEWDGIGIGFDANWFFTIPTGLTDSSEFKMLLSVQDIGVIGWNRRAQRYTNSSTINYSGFEVEDLFDADASIFGEGQLEDTLNIHFTPSAKTMILPGYITFSKVIDYNSTKLLQTTFGIRMRINALYTPLIFGGIDFHPMPELHAQMNASYGGYGDFKMGLRVDYHKKNWGVALASQNLGGFVLNQLTGQSINLAAYYTF